MLIGIIKFPGEDNCASLIELLCHWIWIIVIRKILLWHSSNGNSLLICILAAAVYQIFIALPLGRSIIQSYNLLRWSLPWCDWGIQYFWRSPFYSRGSCRHDSSSRCRRRLYWYEPIIIVLVFLVRSSTTWGGTPNSSWGAVTEKSCDFHHGVMCYTVVLQNLR